MSEISVAILGFGRIGASVAMALRRYNAKGGSHHFSVTGFDNRPSVEKKMTKTNLVDKVVNKAYNAVPEKDIIVIAMPYSEVQATYDLISSDLRPGAVVMDMSPLKQPSLSWADKYLPENSHMVGITPVINTEYLFEGLDDFDLAHEDLFDDGVMLLMPSPSCIKDAVELAVDFSTLLGANPHFVDPAEHDGLVAATEGLPALLGIAAFYILSRSQGWNDGQRLVNPAFGALTHHLFDTHPDDIRDLLLHNRENLLRYVDEMVDVLQGFRSTLFTDDKDALEATIIEASENYEHWYNRRRKNRWDESEKSSDTPSPANDIMRGLMGGFLANKITGKKKQDE